MKNCHEYDNPGRPLPEYLELVNDTQVPPGSIASNAQTKGRGKDYYVPMENGGSNNVLNHSTPHDYVPMDNEMRSNALNNSTPQDYIPMDASNTLPVTRRSDGSAAEKSGPTSSDYYQTMANKGGLSEQESPQTSPLGEYYSPMAENTLSGAAGSGNTQDEVVSSKLWKLRFRWTHSEKCF